MTDAPQDIDELASFLRREFDDADSYYDQLQTVTDQAFAYYEAQPFGNEIEGRSRIVLPDVQETVDYMQQSVLRTFVSGDNTVEFEATDEADEQAADDATAGINYTFMRQQDGFRILHDGLYDGLLKKIGIFKTGMETSERISRETVVDSEEALALRAAMEEGFEVEATEELSDPEMIAGLMQEGIDPAMFVVAQVKTTRKEKRFVDYAVPLSEFRFNPRAKHEDDAHYLGHVCEKTRSDLVEMGFDAEQVYLLPTHNEAPEHDRTESTQLDYYQREENSKALETVLLCEEYARVDVDGDGIAERIKVYRVDNEILIDAETGEPSVETVEDQPFAVFCPFPRPHRMVGYSLADKVMHIQYQRSFVGRQLFDGMALSNLPRYIVDSTLADSQTYEDILAPIPGSPIRAKGGAAAVQPMPSSFDPQKSLAVMEWITGERESLTGITRLNQGLDADALNKTATGTAMMQAQGQQNEEAIARQFAETIARLFAKKYRLMREEGEPFPVKVDGKIRTVNPQEWPERVHMKVRVGLGSNSKDKRLQYRMAMSGPLGQAVANGMAGPEHVFNWFDGIARDTGLGQGDDFVHNPEDQQPEQQEKPDPEMMKIQAEMQMKQQAQQFDQQMRYEDAKFEQELKAAQADFEANLAGGKADFEAELAMFKARIEAALKRNMSDNRPGGDLSK